MHSFRKKFDWQVRNVSLVLCGKLGPVWVKKGNEGAIRERKLSLTFALPFTSGQCAEPN